MTGSQDIERPQPTPPPGPPQSYWQAPSSSGADDLSIAVSA
jgi:hypothetical protein